MLKVELGEREREREVGKKTGWIREKKEGKEIETGLIKSKETFMKGDCASFLFVCANEVL